MAHLDVQLLEERFFGGIYACVDRCFCFDSFEPELAFLPERTSFVYTHLVLKLSELCTKVKRAVIYILQYSRTHK